MEALVFMASETKPMIAIVDCITNVHEVREMTEEEYDALLESGWALEPIESEPAGDE